VSETFEADALRYKNAGRSLATLLHKKHGANAAAVAAQATLDLLSLNVRNGDLSLTNVELILRKIGEMVGADNPLAEWRPSEPSDCGAGDDDG
jgi:hypothetical protein